MTRVIRGLSAATAILSLTLSATGPGPTLAAELTAVEKLYADLGKLPPAERTQKLIDAAKKEG